MIRAAALCLLCLPGAAAAQTYSPCDDYRSSAFALAEPWEDNTMTLADGAVRLAILDTGEPAAGSFFLMVIAPSTDEMEGQLCTLISLDESMGFASLTLEGSAIAGDLTSGLVVTLPATRWLPDTDTYTPAKLTITRDASTAALTAMLE